eukprot:TRINITY_DN7893_c0_g1_i3.p1 TRINITY_DN7893_c0_g1~~TRINITY_DN7893_c0_g1_i3.p1  ORF type:complete len:167 (-),score=29.34 TRINITY_DN7893_c0_g1_i3:206-667(-)
MAMDELKGIRELENTIEQTINTLWNCSVMVEDYKPECKTAFHNNINEFMNQLRSLDELSRKVDAKVPLQVIEAIDHNQNPDFVTKQYLDACRHRNDQVRGRLFATKLLRDQLSAGMQFWDSIREASLLPPVGESQDKMAASEMKDIEVPHSTS